MKKPFSQTLLLLAIFVGQCASHADFNDGLIVYCPFNGNSKDESGHGVDGVVYGATLTEDRLGRPNSAYYFGGDGDFISFPPVGIQTNEGFTVALWLNYEAQPRRIWAIYFDTDGFSTGFHALLNTEQWGFHDTQQGLFNGVQTHFDLGAYRSQWVHLVTKYDALHCALMSYINGALIDSQSTCYFPFSPTGMYVGQPHPGWQGDSYYRGSLDDLRIYNRALSDTEIRALYYSATPSLDLLDARNFRSGSSISTNPTVLGKATQGNPMVGVATDGVAQLLLRVRTNRPGTLTFSISGTQGATGSRAEDGYLISRTGADAGKTHTVAVAPIASGTGEYYAFARYRAPETFPRSSVSADLSAAQRSLQLLVTFQPDDGGSAQTVSRDLVLARPPVILIHGLNSDSTTWKTFEDKLRERIPGIYVNSDFAEYRLNNKAHFSVNEMVPFVAAVRARNAYRDRGWAAVQVDVFGHSMGGILTRIAAGRDDYRRDSNFSEGDFNKLIAIDSPHHGSPFADVVYEKGRSLACGPAIRKLAKIKYPQHFDAFEDLQTFSPALCDMLETETSVPTHVIVGDMPNDIVDLATDLACLSVSLQFPGGCSLWKEANFCGLVTTYSAIFPEGGDYIVTADSQRDGFSAWDTQVSEFPHVHFDFGLPWALGTDGVADRAVELLNRAPDDGAWFADGFPVSSCPEGVRARVSEDVSPTVLSMLGIDITAPQNGSTVLAGQSLTVRVQPSSSIVLTGLMLSSLDSTQMLNTSPWDFSLTIPESVVGPFPIAATGKDAAGTFYTAEIELNVVAPSPLLTLSVTPGTVELTQADLPQSLVVLGNYEDDSQRDLTDPATGTTYSTGDANVATVDASGLVTAVGNGNTTVTVTHGSVSVEVPVVVRMETDVSVAHSYAPTTVPAGQSVTFLLSVANQGAEAAHDVQVEDELPAGSTFVDFYADGWMCIEAGGVVRCNRPTLEAGGSTTIEITAEAPSEPGILSNVAIVRMDGDDRNIENNVSSASYQVVEETRYALTVTKAGDGSGHVGGPGIDCGADCSEDYASDESVTLVAKADAGSIFGGWGQACSGDGDCILTMDANQAVTAAFELDRPRPGIGITPTTGLVTTELGGTDHFSVVLDTQPSADVTLTLSSSDPSEGRVSPTRLTFTAANWSTPQTLTVTGVDDDLLDGDTAYRIITSAASSTDGDYAGMDPEDVAVVNLDEDSVTCQTGPVTIDAPELTGIRRIRSETWLQTRGPVVVPSGARITFEASESIGLAPGFEVRAGAAFRAHVGAVSCGSL